MIPTYENRLSDFTIEEIIQPNQTYRLDVSRQRIARYVDGIAAVEQAVYKILNTERYAYVIYSDRYGLELVDLIGKDKSYVRAILPDRIKDALKCDERIDDVVDFEITEMDSDSLAVFFKVVTSIGDVETRLVVTI